MQAFQVWDVNHTGRIDPTNMGEIPRFVNLKDYDSNKDGLYTKEELMAALSVPAPSGDESAPTEDAHDEQ